MNPDDEGQTVACGSDLVIGHAESIRDALVAALQSQRPIVVDCTDAREIDLSFVQLLLAARASAARRGVSFRVKGADGKLGDVLRAAGLAGDGRDIFSEA